MQIVIAMTTKKAIARVVIVLVIERNQMNQKQHEAFDRLITELETAISYEMVPIRAYWLKDVLLKVRELKFTFVDEERSPKEDKNA